MGPRGLLGNAPPGFMGQMGPPGQMFPQGKVLCLFGSLVDLYCIKVFGPFSFTANMNATFACL